VVGPSDNECATQTFRHVDADGREASRLVDVLTARLSHFDQEKDLQTGFTERPPGFGRVVRIGRRCLSMGDFGANMRDIFDPASQATFAWKRWTTLRGRRTHVSYWLSVVGQFALWGGQSWPQAAF